MTLTFDARIHERDFDVSLAVATGEIVAVIGPNGAGKSTLLQLIAGLLKPDSGRASLDETVLFDRAAGVRGGWTAPHARGISLLAQDSLLFPHLSVLDNVAFGPRSAGIGKREAAASAAEWLGEVDAIELRDRKPAQLSGGQAQRIAVARALAADPRLLLLDEPMAALDVSVAPTLRRMLRRVLEHRTAIIVTHDLLDALLLADRVIVIQGGRVVEEGPTRAVLERPRSTFTAGLAALNLVTGVRTPDGLRTSTGLDVRAGVHGEIGVGTPVAAAITPSSVTVSVDRPAAGVSNLIRGTVQDLEPRGDIIRVRSEHLSADIPPARVADLDLVAGDVVWFAFASDDVTLYPL